MTASFQAICRPIIMTQMLLLQTVPWFADFGGFAGVIEITR